jgi:hypothetical protein
MRMVERVKPTLPNLQNFRTVHQATLLPVHAYCIGYQSNENSSHPVHVDDCEITININLGSHFSGGDLYLLHKEKKNFTVESLIFTFLKK